MCVLKGSLLAHAGGVILPQLHVRMLPSSENEVTKQHFHLGFDNLCQNQLDLWHTE